jgi:DNA-binding response OmpR family regulator/anti-sigma regulatory factor (Ser/Thr protein kinase)
LNIVYRNARRMLSLVDQLLLFRKAESGVDNLHPARLNFYDLCNDVYLCFVQEAKAKKINYLFKCENQELELYLDMEKMEIVFYNIISNAFKYTPEGGTITFAVIEIDDIVEVRITDTGTGISEEVGDKLFDKFYQPVNSKPGFGIGLFLSKNFTEQHKGLITYESESGKGTAFSIRLLKGKEHFDESIITTLPVGKPVFLSELKDQYTAPAGIEKKDSDGLNELITDRQKILVTDDDAQMRQYIINIFKDRFITYEAESGSKGLEMAKQISPDIIISDIKMDGGDGIEFCKSIKNDPLLNHIPVILLTATSSSDLKLEGVESGADDYITKPFEKEILIARVSNLLKTRSNLQRYFFNEITLNKNDLKISEEYKEFLEKCIRIVETHLDDERFTVKDLAQEVGMSHSSVYNKIKEISGQSTNAFIRFIRLRKAAELFINSNDNIGQVSFKVGISDKTHFREHFTKLFGMPPTEYIKKFRKPFNSDYGVDKSAFDPDKG